MRLSTPLLTLIVVVFTASLFAGCSGRVVVKTGKRSHVRIGTKKPKKPKKKVVVVKVKAKSAKLKLVDHALPATPADRRAPLPAYDAIWVSGHYAWDQAGKRYRWVTGQWAPRRKASAWVDGHYRTETRGRHRIRVWVPGHWVAAAPPAKKRPKAKKRPTPKPPKPPAATASVTTKKPPRAKREKQTPMPAARAFWVSGHWSWSRPAAKYIWLGGRWVVEKPGMKWVDGSYHWVQVDDLRVVIWRSGYWEEAPAREPAAEPEITVHELPDPPPMRKAKKPGRGHFWVDGHWEFDTAASEYSWIAGDWVAPRAGARWVSGRYEWATSGTDRFHRWVEGRWHQVTTPRPDPRDKAAATPKPAQRITRIDTPPQPRVSRPARPARDTFWIEGHWTWDRGLDDYRWLRGRWAKARRGATWVSGHYRWARLDAARMVKRWQRGHWVRTPAAEAELTVEQPPEPAAQTRPPRPSDAHVWLDGHWNWKPGDGKYVWSPGAWEEPPAGTERVSGHYAWLQDSGRLVQTWQQGSWSKEHAEHQAEADAAAAGEEPPAEAPDDAPTVRPASDTFWVAGHWRWDAGAQKYEYEKGRWIDRVEGESWIYGAYRWEKRNGKLVRIWQKGYFASPDAFSGPPAARP